MSVPTFAHEIQVFTIKSHPVLLNGETASVCYLDALSTIEEHFASTHPALGLDEIASLEPELTEAMHCQQQALAQHIERLPAIVIDSNKVAYGISSINEALTEGGEHVY